MPDPAELAPKDAPEPTLVAAVVRRAPATLADPVEVVVPSFHEHRLFEIDAWMPRGELLPSVGDRGLVAFAEDGEPWLVAWISG